MYIKNYLVIFFMLASLTISNAKAGLLGENLQLDYRHPDINTIYLGSSYQFTVSNSIEIPNLVSLFSVDVTDTGIVLDWFHEPNQFTPSAFNGIALIDYTGAIGPFLDVTIDPVTNLSGFDSSRISFDANNIYVNFESLNYNINDIVKLDITTGPNASIVPLPATVWLFGTAIASLMGIKRCKPV